MRSFLMLYLSDYETDDYETQTDDYETDDYETDDYVDRTDDDGLRYITAKFRRAEHRAFTLLSSVCWSWHQTMVGWSQSPTPAWLRHQLQKPIQCECT